MEITSGFAAAEQFQLMQDFIGGDGISARVNLRAG